MGIRLRSPRPTGHRAQSDVPECHDGPGADGRQVRVLVLTAPVGAGHDAAAAALADQLREAGAAVEVVDGLALLGVERLVVGGYRFQILHAGWSWRWLYRLSRSRAVVTLAGAALARLGSRRLLARIVTAEPDVIVSAYPIVSMALAGLRRQARLPWRCATLVTDFDPHPAWVHHNLDANLAVGDTSPAGQQIAPPIRDVARTDAVRQAMRRELGIPARARVVLIVGGAWGVGVTGRNERLLRTLRQDRALASATLLGFTHRLPDLMAASDVLIQNAGGLTCLEAFGAGLPVVMFDPLPGHGEANVRLMAESGLVATAQDVRALRETVMSTTFLAGTTDGRPVGRALALFERQSAAAPVLAMSSATITQPSRVRRVAAPLLAVTAVVAVWLAVDGPSTGVDVADGRTPATTRHLAPLRGYESTEIRVTLSPAPATAAATAGSAATVRRHEPGAE
jgi:UDP-N-acetylglucosamine:LPS N-acetylglucosamine transferase